MIRGIPVTSIDFTTGSFVGGSTNVSIPSAVTWIANGCFRFWSSLRTINVETLNPVYSSLEGVLFNKAKSSLIECPAGKGGSYVVPSTVKSIEQFAFLNCTGIVDVSLPLGMLQIGEWAFANCFDLSTINLPKTLKGVGYSAFAACNNLRSITLPDSLSTLEPFTFWSCGNLTNLVLSTTITNIGKYAAADCFKLSDITVPESVLGIDERAFSGCGSLKSVSLGGRIGSLGEWAFAGCYELSSIQIPNSVTNLGNSAFEGCPRLSKVSLGNGITQIGSRAFIGCDRLTEFVIPESLTRLGSYALYGCNSLTSVGIPKGVQLIEDEAFGLCSGLKAIEVDPLNPSYSSKGGTLFDKNQTILLHCPAAASGNYAVSEGVLRIGHNAFRGCGSLTHITIPRSVTGMEWPFFEMCGALMSIKVDTSNSYFRDDEGVLFERDQLLRYPNGKLAKGLSYTIPNGTTRIAPQAFSEAYGLTSVVLPKSLRSIDAFSFAWCTNLKTLFFLGNSPQVSDIALYSTPLEVSYYLPTGSGWGATFAAKPTALWRPNIVLSDGSFGLRANHFQFNRDWATGATIVVEACTNLANPIWNVLTTDTLTGDSNVFSDPEQSNLPARFYRLRSF